MYKCSGTTFPTFTLKLHVVKLIFGGGFHDAGAKLGETRYKNRFKFHCARGAVPKFCDIASKDREFSVMQRG